MRLPYTEGTWFIVPLSPSGYATGVVVRVSKGGRIFLGYFFGPRLRDKPILDQVCDLRPNDAVGVWRVGDLALIEGRWEILGKAPSWDRDEWLVPQFVRRDLLRPRAWQVTYADNDMNVIEREIEITPGNAEYEVDAVRGCGAVEIVLSALLPEQSPATQA